MGFADAYFRAKESKRRDAIYAQQAKLIKMQLEESKKEIDANTTIADILVGSVEEFVPTPAVETPTGETRSIGFTNASREPQGLIEALTGNPDFQNAAIQSGHLQIGDLLDFQAGQNAREQAAELFANQGGGGGRTDAAGNSEFIQGPPTRTTNSDGTMSVTSSLIPNKLFQDPVSAAQGTQDVKHFLSQVDQASIALQSIEGTPLQSGSPVAELLSKTARTASAFGVGGVAEIFGVEEKAPQRRQRAEKLLADNLLSSEQLQQLSENGGRGTNLQWRAVAAATADLGNGMLANMLQMLDAAEIKVINADILGIPMPDPEGTLRDIERRRAAIETELFGNSSTFFEDAQAKFGAAKESASGAVSRASQQAAAIGAMSAEKLMELHRSGVVLSDEARVASIKRLEQLNQQAQDSFNSLAPQVEAIGKMGLAQLQQLQESGVTLAGETKKALDDRWKELAPSRKMLALKAAMEIASARDSAAKQIDVVKTFTLEELAQLGESGLRLADDVRREAERRFDELEAKNSTIEL